MENRDTNAYAYCGGASCEAEVSQAVEVLAGRWAVPVIEALHFAEAPARFRQLQRAIGRISQKELARQLTHLRARGVVRQAQGEPGGTAGYQLTEDGRRLMRHMEALGEWAKAQRLPIEPAAPAAEAADGRVTPCGRASWLAPLQPVRTGRAR